MARASRTPRTYPNLSSVRDPDTQRTIRIIYDLIRAAEEQSNTIEAVLLKVDERLTSVEPRVSSLEKPVVFATGDGLSSRFTIHGVSDAGLIFSTGSPPKFRKLGKAELGYASLDHLGDVLATAPVEGYILRWDSVTSLWTAVEPPEATRVSLTHSALQSSADLATTVLAWDTEVSDPKGLHDPGANTLVTIAEAGVYVASVYITWTASALGVRFVEVEKNVTTRISGETKTATAIGNDEVCMSTPDMVLASGDTLRVRVFQNSGGPLDVLNTLGSPVFTVRKIA